jgi:hypothetical protein
LIFLRHALFFPAAAQARRIRLSKTLQASASRAVSTRSVSKKKRLRALAEYTPPTNI